MNAPWLVTNGYEIRAQELDGEVLYNLANHKFNFDYPAKGYDVDGKYYDGYVEGIEWANYWTNPLDNHPRIRDINKIVTPLVGEFLENPILYYTNISVTTPNHSLIRLHCGTPHKYQPWCESNIMLGTQVAIPMHEVNSIAGSTALLPMSHLKTWDIEKCYSGDYLNEFLANAIQPKLGFGDLLMWDTRMLQTQTPNISGTNCYMLLMNYVEEHIVSELMKYKITLSYE